MLTKTYVQALFKETSQITVNQDVSENSNATQEEKMLPQSKVDELISIAKKKGYERGKKDAL